MDELRKALKTIAAKGDPFVSSRAAQALISNSDEMRQIRFNMLAPQALESGEFTPEEREFIANCINFSDETRDYTLKVRLTEAERFELEAMAEAGGQNVSEYVRSRLFST